MATFAGTATFGLVANYSKASDLSTLQEIINYTNSPTSYTNGTGAYQANTFYSDTRTLAGTNESFDLNAITDGFGTAYNFTKIKLIFVRNRSTTTAQTLILSGDFLSALDGGTGPTHIIGPAGSFLAESPIDGFTVTNTTQDTLTITNAATFDYDIILLGVAT